MDFESRPKKIEKKKKLTPNIRFHIDPWKPGFQGDLDASGFLRLPARISFHSVFGEHCTVMQSRHWEPGEILEAESQGHPQTPYSYCFRLLAWFLRVALKGRICEAQ